MINDKINIQFNGQGTLSIAGQLIVSSVAAIRALGEGHIKKQPALIIDLKAVERCDSSALSLLLAWMRYAKQINHTVRFVNLPQQLLDIAKLSRLNTVLEADV